jgi:hypothetical protein
MSACTVECRDKSLTWRKNWIFGWIFKYIFNFGIFPVWPTFNDVFTGEPHGKMDYFIRFIGCCIPLGISFCNIGQKLNVWVNFPKFSILAFFQFGLLSMMYLLENHTRYDYFIIFRVSWLPTHRDQFL